MSTVDLDQRLADLVLDWQRNAEDAVAIARQLESALLAAERRASYLADEVQTARNEIASLKEQLERAHHALSLTGRTQSAARA